MTSPESQAIREMFPKVPAGETYMSSFINTTIAPLTGAPVAPPSTYTQTSFVKSLDVNGVFVVNDSNLVHEQVPTGTGVFLWHPNRGANSMWRMGIVPASTVLASSDSRLTSGYSFDTMLSVPNNPVGWYLYWQAPVAVPYSSQVRPYDQIKLSPDISTQFSKIRVFAGIVKGTCDTEPIGTGPNTGDIQLTGYWSAGALNDTRTASQNYNGGSYNCYESQDLMQMSVTEKEGFNDLPIHVGVCTVVGSDIQPFYVAPNSDQDDQINGTWSSFPMTGYVLPNDGTYHQGCNAGSVDTVYYAWISPWNTVLLDNNSGQSNSSPAYNAACQNINFGPINEAGVLDVKVDFLMQRSNGLGNPTMNYTCLFTHLFCTVVSDGSVSYQFYKESVTGPVANITDSTPVSFSCTSEPKNYLATGGLCASSTSPGVKQYPGGYTNTGKYIGTQVLLQVSFNTGTGVDAQGGIYNGTLYARPRNMFTGGELGPARVLRYEQVSSNAKQGSVIKIDGTILAQCIPEGTLAPFSRDDVKNSQTAADMNTMTFLAELYNSIDSPYKRNWAMNHYTRFLEMFSGTQMAFANILEASPKLRYLMSSVNDFDFDKPQYMLPTSDKPVIPKWKLKGTWGSTDPTNFANLRNDIDMSDPVSIKNASPTPDTQPSPVDIGFDRADVRGEAANSAEAGAVWDEAKNAYRSAKKYARKALPFAIGAGAVLGGAHLLNKYYGNGPNTGTGTGFEHEPKPIFSLNPNMRANRPGGLELGSFKTSKPGEDISEFEHVPEFAKQVLEGRSNALDANRAMFKEIQAEAIAEGRKPPTEVDYQRMMREANAIDARKRLNQMSSLGTMGIAGLLPPEHLDKSMEDAQVGVMQLLNSKLHGGFEHAPKDMQDSLDVLISHAMEPHREKMFWKNNLAALNPRMQEVLEPYLANAASNWDKWKKRAAALVAAGTAGYLLHKGIPHYNTPEVPDPYLMTFLPEYSSSGQFGAAADWKKIGKYVTAPLALLTAAGLVAGHNKYSTGSVFPKTTPTHAPAAPAPVVEAAPPAPAPAPAPPSRDYIYDIQFGSAGKWRKRDLLRGAAMLGAGFLGHALHQHYKPGVRDYTWEEKGKGVQYWPPVHGRMRTVGSIPAESLAAGEWKDRWKHVGVGLATALGAAAAGAAVKHYVGKHHGHVHRDDSRKTEEEALKAPEMKPMTRTQMNELQKRIVKRNHQYWYDMRRDELFPRGVQDLEKGWASYADASGEWQLGTSAVTAPNFGPKFGFNRLNNSAYADGEFDEIVYDGDVGKLPGLPGLLRTKTCVANELYDYSMLGLSPDADQEQVALFDLDNPSSSNNPLLERVQGIEEYMSPMYLATRVAQLHNYSDLASIAQQYALKLFGKQALQNITPEALTDLYETMHLDPEFHEYQASGKWDKRFGSRYLSTCSAKDRDRACKDWYKKFGTVHPVVHAAGLWNSIKGFFEDPSTRRAGEVAREFKKKLPEALHEFLPSAHTALDIGKAALAVGGGALVKRLMPSFAPGYWGYVMHHVAETPLVQVGLAMKGAHELRPKAEDLPLTARAFASMLEKVAQQTVPIPTTPTILLEETPPTPATSPVATAAGKWLNSRNLKRVLGLGLAGLVARRLYKGYTRPYPSRFEMESMPLVPTSDLQSAYGASMYPPHINEAAGMWRTRSAVGRKPKKRQREEAYSSREFLNSGPSDAELAHAGFWSDLKDFGQHVALPVLDTIQSVALPALAGAKAGPGGAIVGTLASGLLHKGIDALQHADGCYR